MKQMIRLSIGMLVVLHLSSCLLGPKHRCPLVLVPLSWQVERTLHKEVDFIFDEGPLALSQVFDDPLLATYLESLIYNNHNLRLAFAKVCEAFALRQMSSAKRWPFIDGRIDYHSSKPAGGILTGNQQTGTTGGGILGGIPINLKQQSFLADFDAVWEIDFFGKTRREIESATAFIGMEIESYYSTLVSLLAEFARTYFELRRIQKTISLLKEEIIVLEEKGEALRTRFEDGLDAELSTIELDADLDRVKGELPFLEGEMCCLIYRLSVMGGLPPDTLQQALRGESFIPRASQHVPVGMPADLLRRRPDIRQAERQIAKSTADVGVAVAELFPKIVIDGSYGFQNLHLGNLKGSGESWSYGGNILTPLFHGGRLRANVRRYQWIRKEAFILYEQKVLQALEESECAMSRVVKSNESLEEKEQVWKRRKELLSHAEKLYANGLTNTINFLDAKVNAIEAERNWIDQLSDSGIQLIALFKALGGGWRWHPECSD